MNNKNKIFILGAVVSALISAGIHTYLAYKYFLLKFGLSTGMSSCNINAVFNCDATTASSYSSLFGIPIALFGLSSHLILVFLLLIAYFGMADRPEKYHRSSLLLSSLITLACLGMAAVSSFILHTHCLYCMATYAFSILAFILILLSSTEKFSWTTEIISYFTTDRSLLVWLASVPVLAFVFNSMMVSQLGGSNMDRTIAEKVYQWSSSPTQNFNLQQGLILKSSESPKITIVEFADYLCPHCRHAYPSLHSFTMAHSDVQLIFKTFPLDGVCNPDPKMQEAKGNGVRCRLSLSTICAEKMNQKGWDLHHAIFDHQDDFFSITTIQAADQKICSLSSLDCKELISCMDSPETLQQLRSQAQEGIAANISGTPAIFLNGKQLIGGQILSILEKAYEEAKK